jgi:hypothetical protein
MIDALGHLAYLFLFVGMFLLARGHRAGWLLRIVGSLMWAALGFPLAMTSIILWDLAGAGIDAYGFYRWRTGK